MNIVHDHDMGHRRIGIISEACYSRSDVADKCRECSLTCLLPPRKHGKMHRYPAWIYAVILGIYQSLRGVSVLHVDAMRLRRGMVVGNTSDDTDRCKHVLVSKQGNEQSNLA